MRWICRVSSSPDLGFMLGKFRVWRLGFHAQDMICRYCKFDTFTPAVERGLPVTRVISRIKLQEILCDAVGPTIIQNGANVIDFVDDGSKVSMLTFSKPLPW
jgi:hypothetical protein